MVPETNLESKLKPRTAILSGPTATGKSALALEFARGEKKRGTPIEIINADSLLIYRGMDIGTAKPSRAELEEIPHHLIDIREPDENFTAGDFARLVHETIERVESDGHRALIVGGSGFYLKALLYGLWDGPPSDSALRGKLEEVPSEELYARLYEADSEAALRIGVNDRYRLVRAHELIRLSGKTPSQLEAERNREPDPSLQLLAIDRPTEELHLRVAKRTREMLRAGLAEEVRSLRKEFPGARALGAVGYEQTTRFLEGLAPEGRKSRPGIDGLMDEIELATRQLIKKQRTWFRGEKNAERFELERDRESLIARLKEIYR